MGFILNSDENLCLEDGEVKEPMKGWSILEVAIAHKRTKIAAWLLKQPKTLVYSRQDLSLPDLEHTRSPNLFDISSNQEMLDFEIRPLFAALVT